MHLVLEPPPGVPITLPILSSPNVHNLVSNFRPLQILFLQLERQHAHYSNICNQIRQCHGMTNNKSRSIVGSVQLRAQNRT